MSFTLEIIFVCHTRLLLKYIVCTVSINKPENANGLGEMALLVRGPECPGNHVEREPLTNFLSIII
jgi:hypothetical protein